MPIRHQSSLRCAMGDSIILTLSGNTSVLQAEYFPPIELNPSKHYVLGLVEFLTFNAIPNIDSTNNKFHIGDKIITLPTGSYEIGDIGEYLQAELAKTDIKLTLRANNNTLCAEIESNKQVDFSQPNSIGDLLGFTSRILEANQHHSSDSAVRILKLNVIRVESNITCGEYLNDQQVHTIYAFFPSVPPGFKIIEKPSTIIYLPVTVSSIDQLQLRVIDQDNNLVNFRDETITVRLHIKSWE